MLSQKDGWVCLIPPPYSFSSGFSSWFSLGSHPSRTFSVPVVCLVLPPLSTDLLSGHWNNHIFMATVIGSRMRTSPSQIQWNTLRILGLSFFPTGLESEKVQEADKSILQLWGRAYLRKELTWKRTEQKKKKNRFWWHIVSLSFWPCLKKELFLDFC